MTIMQTLGKYKDILSYILLALVVFGIVVWLINLRLEMLDQPFLGGALNIAFLNVPAYLFVGLGLVLLIIFAEFVMQWFYWKPFAYMHGLYKAYWDKTKACFIGDLKNRYQLIEENKAKLVHPHEEYVKLYDAFFATRSREDQLGYFVSKMTAYIGFHRNYDMMIAHTLEPGFPDKSIVHAGGVEIDLLFDFDNWMYTNTPQRKEMVRVTDMWNEMHPEDEIYTVLKFQNYLLRGEFDGIYNPDILKKTVKIPWARIKAAFPTKGATTPGYERQRAKEIEDETEGDLKGYVWPVVGLTVIMVLLLFGMRAIHLVGHAGGH